MMKITKEEKVDNLNSTFIVKAGKLHQWCNEVWRGFKLVEKEKFVPN